MDSRNGKRPFSSDEPKAKEEDNHIDQDESLFLAYSDRSRQDMSAIVSVLSQVLGSTGENQASSDSVIDSSATVSANLQSTAPAPVRQNQSQVIKGKGISIYINICLVCVRKKKTDSCFLNHVIYSRIFCIFRVSLTY